MKKLALEGVFSPLVLLWCVLLNLTLAEKDAFFVTCEMPQVKVEKAIAFVDMATHQPGCRTVTERQHAELAGNVQWWATTAPALRAVLPPLFSMCEFCECFVSVCCVTPASCPPGPSWVTAGMAARPPGKAAASQARPSQAQERNRNGQVAVTGASQK